MRLRTTLSLTAAIAGVMAFGVVSTANALWTANDAVVVPEPVSYTHLTLPTTPYV